MTSRITGGDGSAGPRRCRLLAEMLTCMIAGVMPDPGEAAAEAAREWGRYPTEPQPPYQRLDAEQAIGKLAAALAEIGFAPEASPGAAAGSLAPVLVPRGGRASPG